MFGWMFKLWVLMMYVGWYVGLFLVFRSIFFIFLVVFCLDWLNIFGGGGGGLGEEMLLIVLRVFFGVLV